MSITNPSTTLPLLLMTESTFERRLQQLISQLENHPHREEIVTLAYSQLEDDSTIVLPAVFG